MELLTKLGIDYRLLIAQFVNFLILFLVLYHFAYKPILKILRDRQTKVRSSLDKAEKIDKEWLEFKEKKATQLKKLQVNEIRLMKQAEAKAVKIQEEKMQETEDKVKKLVAKAKEELLAEKVKMTIEAKAEIKTLAKDLALRVLEVNMTPERRQNLVKQTMESKSEKKWIKKL